MCDAHRYPLVFHCFAGKDRTGILTALVLGLLGVADDDIAADYALSAAAMHRLLDWLRAQYRRRRPARAAGVQRRGHRGRRARDHGRLPAAVPGRLRVLRGLRGVGSAIPTRPSGWRSILLEP